MANDDHAQIKWTPELERRYQHVDVQYDKARGLGIELLKILLSTAVIIAGVPIIFYDKLQILFDEGQQKWLFTSWVLILLAIILGFLAYFFIFEGYYHKAHFEAARWLGNDSKNTKKLNESHNWFLDRAHYAAIGFAVCFSLALASTITAIILKLWE